MRFSAYVATIAVLSTVSLIAIFHGQANLARQMAGRKLQAANRAPGMDAKQIAAYGRLPLSFQENLGQTDSRVRFVSRGSGYELFLTQAEAVLALRHSQPAAASPRERVPALRRDRAAHLRETASVLRVRFAGSNPAAEITGDAALPGRVDYFIGKNPANWRTNVPSYARVKYRSIYPGVDLIFYGNQRRLEYDFIVAPDADPKAIALEVEGANRLRIDAGGNLMMGVEGGEVELQKPIVYQQANGVQREIPAVYALAGTNRVTFQVSDYDRSLPLVVDPTVFFATYVGGGDNDSGLAIAINSANNQAAIAGQTFSTDFPVPSGTNTLPNGAGANVTTQGNAFVSVLSADGASLVYSAYLSGNGANGTNITPPGQDLATWIVYDKIGDIYLTGDTFSTDFPVTTATSPSGLAGLITTQPDRFGSAFLTKINPSATGPASLVYSTYLGGSGSTMGVGDAGGAVAVDANGNAYVVGRTSSADFPQMNPIPSPPNFANLPNTLGSAFVTIIATTKSGPNSLVFSTFLGGDGAHANGNATFREGFAEKALGVAVDSQGNAYVTGITTSSGTTFPTTSGASQPIANSANVLGGAFFSKLNTVATGPNILVYSTYLEGNIFDTGLAIALSGPDPFITGFTASTSGFPVTNTTPTATLPQGAFPSAPSGAGIPYLVVFDTSKIGNNSLKYSALFGGTTGSDVGFGVAVDGSGNAYLAGRASSTDFPITSGALQAARLNQNGDAFVVKINPAGNGTADLVYSSLFGGSGPVGGTLPDAAFGIAVDSAPLPGPNVYITGQTPSTPAQGFPITPGAFQATLDGPSDAFIAKLNLVPNVAVSPSSIAFGSVAIGTISVPVTLVITNNTGTFVAFNASPFTFTGPNATDFAVAPGGGCGTGIAAGASCTEGITFAPSAPPRAESATLNLNDSASGSPQTVSLTGTGQASISVAPSSIAFGSVTIGTISVPVTLVITNNTGTFVAFNASPFTFTGPNATDFAVAPGGGCGTGIAAGASCTEGITFAPSAPPRAESATLNLNDSASGSPQTVSLSGTGTAAAADFAITAPPTFTVQQGRSGTFQIGLVSVGSTFEHLVTLACTGAPANTECQVPFVGEAPGRVGGAVLQVNVIIRTNVRLKGSVSPPAAPLPPSLRLFFVSVLAIALMCLVSAHRRHRMALGLAAAVLLLVVAAGCRQLETPVGTTNLTITGTSGNLSHSAIVALTVTAK